MEDIARPRSQAFQVQRTCTICGAKGHIARGHIAWQEREAKRIAREERRAAKAAAEAPISATSSRRKRQPRGRRDSRPDVDDVIEEVQDEVQERLDAMGASDSDESTPDVDIGDVRNLQPWAQAALRPLNELELRDTAVVRSAEDTIPAFSAGRRPHFGPTNIPEGTSTPGDFFGLFFTNELLDHFVTATNGYAETSKSFTEDLTRDELKTFIALIFLLGLVKHPSYLDAWSGITASHFMMSMMTATRFKEIWEHLHFTNTRQYTQEQREERNKADPFWVVRGLMDDLCDKSGRYWTPRQCMSVDEQAFLFKGRHRCKCYNKDKPNKWHFKLYCLNCSESNYLVNFFIYEGRDHRIPPDTSASNYPVLKLTDDPRFHHKNHIVAVDNWFTSLTLVQRLWARGIHCVGTIRTNRKGLPREAILKKTGRDKAPRGHCISMESAQMTSIEGSVARVYITGWMDKKPVHMVHTWPTFLMPVHRKVSARESNTGRFERIELTIPTVIKVYNKYMGGTDGFDQALSYYELILQSKKWYKRFFTHFLNVAKVNAHILYAHAVNKGCDLKMFTYALINEWAKRPPSDHKRHTGRGPRYRVHGQMKKTGGLHTPIYLKSVKRQDRRRVCVTCDVRTNQACKECNVGCCFLDGFEDGMTSCWEIWHETGPDCLVDDEPDISFGEIDS